MLGSHSSAPRLLQLLVYSNLVPTGMPHSEAISPHVVEVNNSSCHSCYRLNSALSVHLVKLFIVLILQLSYLMVHLAS
jgi:hypothetical protein